jgi:uncharacterized protein YegP (UPF0339 family)
MGANAQTTVPSFLAAQVLTADQMNQSARTGVPVFATTVERDAAFGGAGEKVLAEGQLCYLEDANVVQYYDGSVWATVGPATAGGLVLVQAETAFGAVGDVTADGVFTSAYTNYRIIFRYQSSSGQVRFRLRAATVDTSTGYNSQEIVATGTTMVPARQASQTSAEFASNSGGAFFSSATIELYAPQLAEPTVYNSLNTRNDGAYTFPIAQTYFGNQSASTAFDGIKFLTSASTFTSGSYTIYGYAKA